HRQELGSGRSQDGGDWSCGARSVEVGARAGRGCQPVYQRGKQGARHGGGRGRVSGWQNGKRVYRFKGGGRLRADVADRRRTPNRFRQIYRKLFQAATPATSSANCSTSAGRRSELDRKASGWQD